MFARYMIWRDPSLGNKVTIYDVAAAARVSISTVSQVLNRPDRVREPLRDRVLAAVEGLGYVPAADAASRARSKAARIGVVAPLTSYNSYMRRLAGVLDVLGPLGKEVCVFDHESATRASPLLASLPFTRRVDGLIVMGLSMEDAIADRVARQGLPTVFVDFPTSRFTSVGIDNHLGGRMVAEHVWRAGHRRFVWLQERASGWEELDGEILLAGHRRIAGFKGTIESFGGDPRDIEVFSAAHSIANAKECLARRLSGGEPPLCVIGHDDTLAVGAIVALRERGLRVPEQVAVMGFDDGDMAVAADLTTVRQPFEQSGRVAAHALIQHIDDPGYPPQTISLGVELVIRGSA